MLKQEIVIIITDYIAQLQEDLHISGAVMVCIYTVNADDTVTSGTMPTEWDSSVSTSDDRIKHNEKKLDGLKVINQYKSNEIF